MPAGVATAPRERRLSERGTPEGPAAVLGAPVDVGDLGDPVLLAAGVTLRRDPRQLCFMVTVPIDIRAQTPNFLRMPPVLSRVLGPLRLPRHPYALTGSSESKPGPQSHGPVRSPNIYARLPNGAGRHIANQGLT